MSSFPDAAPRLQTQTGVAQTEVKSSPQPTTITSASQAPPVVTQPSTSTYPHTSAPVQPQAVVATPILAPPSTETKPQASSTPLIPGLSAGEELLCRGGHTCTSCWCYQSMCFRNYT